MRLRDLPPSPHALTHRTRAQEGAEYNVELKFKVNHGLVSGLKYIQAVRRLGATGALSPPPLSLSLSLFSCPLPSALAC